MYGRPGSAAGGGGGSIDRGGFATFTAKSAPTPTSPTRSKHATVTPTRARPVSAIGSMESVRSAEVTAGTVRSDPGSRTYATDNNSGVCFDEKVLKQIR